MNTNPAKKEYPSDDELERLLRCGEKVEIPPESSFRAMLQLLPGGATKSPYRFQRLFTVVKSRALPILAILLVVGSATAYVHNTLVSQGSSAQVLAVVSADDQLGAIDMQLGSLDIENSTVDQVLSHQEN